MKGTPVGDGFTFATEKDGEHTIGVLRFDLNAVGGPSNTGKTLRVASTEGNVKLPESDVYLGANAYRKAPPK